MGFKVAGYSFTGRYPIDDTGEIKDWPGLYAVLCYRDNRHYLVDVGESDDVKSEVESNGRKALWNQYCSGTLVVSVYYMPEMEQSERARIERKIRTRHNPPCGKRYRL